jgi:hypothetical protein
VEDGYKSHQSKGQEALEIKTSLMLRRTYLLYILECHRVSREQLTMCLVVAGSTSRAGICLTTPHPKVH